MATKKQLQQALSFSRRRLMTALVSGRPGGKELEPAKPLRAVTAGLVLAAMVVAASAIVGFLKPGLPDGWDSNSLIIADDSGGLYAAIDTTLYPVVNATSARLLIPAAQYKVVTTNEDKLAGTARGSTLGIVGAPAAPPPAADLVADGWVSCVAPGGQNATIIDTSRQAASATDGAALVEVDGAWWLVVGATRYSIDAAYRDGVVRVLGLARSEPIAASAEWLNLFTEGSPLSALQVPGSGTAPAKPLQINGSDLVIGTVIEATNGTQTSSFVVTAAGEIAALSPLAAQLALLASPPQVAVPSTAIGGVATSTIDVVPPDWPTNAPAPVGDDDTACAVLSAQRGAMSTAQLAILNPPTTSVTPPYLDAEGHVIAGVFVRPGRGALVRATPASSDSMGATVLIDDSGHIYPIPKADNEVLARLGYAPTDVTAVPARWIDLFPRGPALTTEAAGMAIGEGQ